MTGTYIQRILKRGELFIRRLFISLLSQRSRKTANVHPLPLNQNPKIVFLRQDRLGDAIISTPLLVALRAKYPTAEMMVLLGENNKGIIPLLPIECETFIYRKKLFSDIKMLHALRKRNIDVLIDLQDNASATSSILTAAIAPQYSVGIDKENASSYNVLVPRLDQSQYHIARRLAELLTPFDIDPTTISLTPILKDIPSFTTRGKVGVVYSAGVLERCIPVSKCIEIVNALVATGVPTEIAIFSHPKDKLFADEIVSSSNNSLVNAAPQTNSFLEYAALLRTCSLVISPDTSAVHLCSAYNIPVIMIAKTFPPTLHYWTPIGVTYRMIAEDKLSDVDVNQVITFYNEIRLSLEAGSRNM